MGKERCVTDSLKRKNMYVYIDLEKWRGNSKSEFLCFFRKLSDIEFKFASMYL